MEERLRQQCGVDEDRDPVVVGLSDSGRPTSPLPAGSSHCTATQDGTFHDPPNVAEPSSSEEDVPTSSKRKQKAKAAKRDRRARKRRRLKEQMDDTEYYHRPSLSQKYQDCDRVRTTFFKVEDLPTTSNGFTGKIQPLGDRVKTLQELLDEGFRLQPWDGVSPIVFEDIRRRIFLVLAGRPVGDPTWSNLVSDVDAVLAKAAEEVKITVCKNCRGQSWEERCAKCRNRRGDFKSLTAGVSFGGGQMSPNNLVNSPRDARVVSNIVKNKSIQRLAGYINGAFAFYGPNLWQFYAKNSSKLHDHHPNLERLFPRSVFPAAAFNLGPQVATLEHVDSTNLPFGWCAIYASGNFDPKRGGHLILRDLKLVIEFPPGSVVFIPSGTLLHGNAAIQQHETRRSFTQYAAGGLFRWVYYGFRTEKVLELDDEERLVHSTTSAPTRIREALGLFSTVNSLHRDRVRLAT
ncbi:hypothetical protein EIP86_008920 [Pleurotus ostreatoroseus]|nr:hypothetical protein EIP86_008920 [Pleurotus ostreatoroseus]